jgi:hypothetical protein
VPQISEHWPNKRPGLTLVILKMFRRPGVESAFTLNAGIAQACSTSVDVVTI